MKPAAADRIEAHLFVIAPNNSGSTVLRNAISVSSGCWRLAREGQHVEGFAGPSTRSTGTRLIWAATPDRLAPFLDPASFDWECTRRAWHKQAVATDPTSRLLVVSSPPFLFSLAALKQEFPHARFLFLTRNPYASVAGILRRADQQALRPSEDIRLLAARHIVVCLERQRENITRFGAGNLSLTYEELCADPTRIAERIGQLVPELPTLDLTGPILAKGIYDEPLRDMNDEQIAALDFGDRKIIERVFADARETLAWFGYGPGLA